VRLWVDDASALAWMAPSGAPGVEVRAWPSGGDVDDLADVLVEAFGCQLPAQRIEQMGSVAVPPVWVNLEYLSAETYVERCHALPSPVYTAAGVPLRRRFFFPGFTPGTGGLIREPGLMARGEALDRSAWLASSGLRLEAGEQLVSLFCYEQCALPALIDRLAQQPCLLLVTPGHAQRQVRAILGPALRQGSLRAHPLPLLTQLDYDRLLWACDLNFVRGEDSFVRAQWAGKPFVWQAYPQQDGVHLAKVDAFLARHLGAPQGTVEAAIAGVWRCWNADTPRLPPLPDWAAWSAVTNVWRSRLLEQQDLSTQLIAFANHG
jgi:uncharacterized repeat protein (TIGR03837 family)